MRNFAVVVCSRLSSRRLHEKAFFDFAGRKAIEHLCLRLSDARLKTIVAVPVDEVYRYSKETTLSMYTTLLGSPYIDDPLRRTLHAAYEHNLDFVIRITHDKIFIDTHELLKAIAYFIDVRADYMYSSELTDGTGFEIISTHLLERSAQKYKDVEHISYPAKFLASNPVEYKPTVKKENYRLLLDYEDDARLFDVIFSTLGADCKLNEVLSFLYRNPKIASINTLPEVTVYTCAFNAEKYIRNCIESVQMQVTSFPYEYVIVDDCSTDSTLSLIANNHDRWVKNRKNIGLSSSSNVALSLSRGRYILRMDADDFFVKANDLQKIYDEIKRTKTDVIYPANYHGHILKTQLGHEQHHVGGALFDKRSLEFLKFKEGLRNYEGLDLFTRARESLRIGYMERPNFFYRQHDESMSKNNLEEREKTKLEILGGQSGEKVRSDQSTTAGVKRLQ